MNQSEMLDHMKKNKSKKVWWSIKDFVAIDKSAKNAVSHKLRNLLKWGYVTYRNGKSDKQYVNKRAYNVLQYRLVGD